MPPRKIMVSAAERLALQYALDVAQRQRDAVLSTPKPPKEALKQAELTVKGLSSLAEKARKAVEVSAEESRGLSLAAAEEALGGSRKYARFAGGDASSLSRRLAQLSVTREQLQTVGAWCDRQTWLQDYSMDLLLAKWTSWLARAASAQSSYVTMAPAGFED